MRPCRLDDTTWDLHFEATRCVQPDAKQLRRFTTKIVSKNNNEKISQSLSTSVIVYRSGLLGRALLQHLPDEPTQVADQQRFHTKGRDAQGPCFLCRDEIAGARAEDDREGGAETAQGVGEIDPRHVGHRV